MDELTNIGPLKNMRTPASDQALRPDMAQAPASAASTREALLSSGKWSSDSSDLEFRAKALDDVKRTDCAIDNRGASNERSLRWGARLHPRGEVTKGNHGNLATSIGTTTLHAIAPR